MTTLLTPKAAPTAFRCAKGDYQTSLVAGNASWAGSDLRGTAARYSGRYRDSRETLIAAMKAAGLVVERTTGARGRIVLAIMLKAERRRATETPAADLATAIIERAEKAKANAKLRAERAERRAKRELAEDIASLATLAPHLS